MTSNDEQLFLSELDNNFWTSTDKRWKSLGEN